MTKTISLTNLIVDPEDMNTVRRGRKASFNEHWLEVLETAKDLPIGSVVDLAKVLGSFDEESLPKAKYSSEIRKHLMEVDPSIKVRMDYGENGECYMRRIK